MTNSSTATAWASQERPIDLVHLSRATLGDKSLEREVLQLFEKQSRNYVAKLSGSREFECVRLLAHTLKGSAKGIGAWKVAEIASNIEMMDDESTLSMAVAELAVEVETAASFIDHLMDAA